METNDQPGTLPGQETFGLPPCDTHLIAKLRAMDPALLASIRTVQTGVKA